MGRWLKLRYAVDRLILALPEGPVDTGEGPYAVDPQVRWCHLCRIRAERGRSLQHDLHCPWAALIEAHQQTAGKVLETLAARKI